MAVELHKGRAVATLSLTPMIDVLFMLLIFFLVTSRFDKEDREMDMPLPDASEAVPVTVAPKELFININLEGHYFVNGQTLEADELEDVLVRAATNNPGSQSVIVRAHKDVPYHFVVRAINLCKRAGIQEYMTNIAGQGR
ncbi:MAG: biopolymer transporter ExbD [Planctomycetaceae bacterium]|nr:biopolymer transporter ExbD [Planctomycetaceae bacterium]